MEFELSESHKILKDTLRKYCDTKLGPAAEEIDRKDEFPEWLWPSLSELGLMGITIPEDFGGAGCDVLSAAIVMEELSRVSPAVSLSWMAHAILCAHNIHMHANPAQRKKYLPELCSGKKIGALALTEPNAGSDAVSIQTSAVKKGDKYIINGTKTFITNGPISDVFVFYAKTAKEKKAQGITAFIGEKNFKGFSVSKRMEKMGHRGSPTGELVFEDCEVPAENVLMSENIGVSVMMDGLDVERTVIAAGGVGVGQAALEYSVKYAREREQFGQPIGKFQFIQGKIADMYTEVEAARLLVHRAAVAADKIKRGGKGTEINRLAASAALFAGEMSERASLNAIQIFGGYGYTLEYPVNRLLRDAKLYTIGAGTSEVRRIIIARELLQLK